MRSARMVQHFRLYQQNVNSVEQQKNMAQQSKTEIYLKIKKPLLERQRRARINKSLEVLKKLVADLQADDAVLRMDKAELLEQTLVFVRQNCSSANSSGKALQIQQVPMDAFRHGYMNAVNEVSRVMASTPGMRVELGKSVMAHLGQSYNRLREQQKQMSQKLQQHHLCTAEPKQQVCNHQQSKFTHMQTLSIECSPPASPASSGYHSACESPAASPVAVASHSASGNIWRPW